MLKFATRILNRIRNRVPDEQASRQPKAIKVVANPDSIPLPGEAKRVAKIYGGDPSRQIIDYETDSKH